jgi:hypothetical protein
MKACCCPLRIGALCGLGGALVWNIALAGFLWSGFTGFDNDSADRADRFCSYDEDVTMATHTNYRAASVCSHEADPCMKDGVKLTHDDFLAQGQIGQGLGGFFQTQFLAQILFCIIGLVGVGLKNKMISKIAVGLIVILLIGFTATWIGFFTWNSQYYEIDGANLQYWAFWKNVTCSAADAGMSYTDAAKNMKDSFSIEPLHAMDHADEGPLSTRGTEAMGGVGWCTTRIAPGWSSTWQQVDKTGPADTEAECENFVSSYFSVGALIFFVLTWLIAVPLQAWNAVAVWQAANEFGKAPEGKATVQGQA